MLQNWSGRVRSGETRVFIKFDCHFRQGKRKMNDNPLMYLWVMRYDDRQSYDCCILLLLSIITNTFYDFRFFW